MPVIKCCCAMFKRVWRVFVYVADCQEESPRDVHYFVDKVRIYDKIIINSGVLLGGTLPS